MRHNSHSISHINRYATLADEAEVEVSSLHSVTDDNYSISTEQELADKEEQLRIGQLQLENKLRLLDEISSNLSNYTQSSDNENELDFQDKEMTSVLPVLDLKEELCGRVEGVIVRADVQLFMDQRSNLLAKAQHPLHSGGCAYLLDDQTCYRRQVGDSSASLPTVTDCPSVPSTLVTNNVVWKRYDQMSKVFILENHCRDEVMKSIVNQYPGIMSQLNTADFDALSLDLTFRAAFKHIMKNITDVVTTREEYMKTNAKLIMLSFQASDKDGVQNYFIKVTKRLRRLAVLNNKKAYDSELLVAQCQSRICDLGICKRELRKIDREWARDDQGKDPNTRFERFKTYYITKKVILAADELQGTTNWANSAMKQKITYLKASLHNSVLFHINM